jgi:hypothetical protein
MNSYQLAGKGKAIYNNYGVTISGGQSPGSNYAASISLTLTSFIITNKYI